ncbi:MULTISPECIES: DUF3618 domain-containing protein [Methylobacterium]|jgi:hypothetical protein|uniref:DUF3618 domain-containing protein n=1 Tax=Methylobacterium bullatum TaxID=570505 RepID=A0A679K1Q8_9HYPH|nr:MULTISPECIES: DUF3618 domain-containing protein [Methylobacterium]KQO41089.1 hypothetical protein ASF08_15065 [Methylobacterium sp. Leaf85]KQP40128.1 hypothetical protein ASF34_12500 [Methylobacterium sp. Leaf106]MBD8901001.1 hypothetical protein [Methylobacterium bullatum]TXN22484.1 DUF3618 domain-containing protein [Methylobacterium sp. WL19]CAA2143428.1 hypothetical protein MBLL_02819 [Methylobacterium bullatum]
MSESLNDLEKDIEASRARLDQTIDRIQDRLSVPSIVDDMLGNVRRTPLSGAYDGALDAIRRNPVPVLLIAAGIGWLLHRTGKDRQTLTKRSLIDPDGALPVTPGAAAKAYDPDQPTRQPVKELAEETQI